MWILFVVKTCTFFVNPTWKFVVNPFCESNLAIFCESFLWIKLAHLLWILFVNPTWNFLVNLFVNLTWKFFCESNLEISDNNCTMNRYTTLALFRPPCVNRSNPETRTAYISGPSSTRGCWISAPDEFFKNLSMRQIIRI